MKGFIAARALSIARKEVRHIVRDPFTLMVALGLPLAMVIFFGYAIDFDVRNIRLAVVDRDASPASREVSRVFSSSHHFDAVPALGTEALALLDSERAKAALFIEPDFQEHLGRGEPASLQLVLDGADNQTTGVIASYLGGIQNALAGRLSARPRGEAIRIETRFIYNPELNSRWFIVPGLTVLVIGILSILLTALTIAREWERGSMELLLSTPARPLEIIVGKIAPYTVIGLLAAAFVYLAARLVFAIPFRGSHLLFLGSTLLFLTAAMAQGVVISVVTRQQQLAMLAANISGLLPNLLLSGFIFPVESMPPVFQKLTAVLAPRWFMEISRGIYLKGAGPAELAVPLVALAVIGALLVLAAVRKFKTDLEP